MYLDHKLDVNPIDIQANAVYYNPGKIGRDKLIRIPVRTDIIGREKIGIINKQIHSIELYNLKFTPTRTPMPIFILLGYEFSGEIKVWKKEIKEYRKIKNLEERLLFLPHK